MRPDKRAYLPASPSEDPDGLRAATGALVDATRRLMQRSSTAEVSPEVLLEASSAVEQIVATLGDPGNRVTRAAFDEVAVRRVRAGATWMMAPYNPMTVPMEITIEGKHAYADLLPGPLLEGPPGLLHGGFAAHMIDALLGALVQVQGQPGYTVRLDLAFRGPTDLSRPIRVEGILGEADGRKMRATGRISQDGECTVEAEALFIKPPEGAPVIE